jgi:hypothetical protein
MHANLPGEDIIRCHARRLSQETGTLGLVFQTITTVTLGLVMAKTLFDLLYHPPKQRRNGSGRE